jgi:hypothetical protein
MLRRFSPAALVIVTLTFALPAVHGAQGGIGGVGGIGGTGGVRIGGGSRLGGGGPGGGGGIARRGGARAPEFPKAKDLEQFNATLPLLDQRRQLHLSDSSEASLTRLRATLNARNSDLIARYDSVRRDFKMPKPQRGGDRGRGRRGGEDTPASDTIAAPADAMEKARIQMRVMWDVGDQLMARRTNDVADCLNAIPPEQYGQAQRLLDEQTSQLRELLAQTSMPPQRR